LLAAKTVDVDDKLLFDYNDHQSSLEFQRLCPVCHICHALHEYNTMIRCLMSIVILLYFQKAYVAQNTTTDEFVHAKTTTDSRDIVLLVKEPNINNIKECESLQREFGQPQISSPNARQRKRSK